ncbi:MAG: asparaginase [Intrasporangiaceae bacterium]|nr:asparaginase [Intrasporangiaceae bacterium]
MSAADDTAMVAGGGRAGAAPVPGADGAPILAEVTRQDLRTGTEIIESIHLGHLVIVGPDGRVRAALGDPDRPTLVRSSAKPFQALACLQILGDQGRDLGDEEIAVAWSSHRAEPRHLEAVRRLLARSGTPEDALTCPVAVGEHDPSGTATRLRRDCSGKHALFALAGRALGVVGDDLIDPDGLLQRRILQFLDEQIGPLQGLAVDGCGAPAVQVPLAGLARGFAMLAADGLGEPIRASGFAHPGLVGGEGRAESALLAAGIVAKPGAEGVFGAGAIDASGDRVGIAVKILDGSARGAATAVVGVLQALGLVTAGVWSAPAPTGGGRPVGEVRAAANIQRVADRLH